MPKSTDVYFDDNYKSIYCTSAGSEWKDFIKLIKTSVENRNSGETPWPKVNQDQSVSIFLSQSEPWNSQIMEEKFIADHLEFHRQRLGFPLIGNAETVLTIIKGDKATEIIEYRFNLSPYHLDSILKLNKTYAGYDTENNLIKLVRGEFSLKPGVIALFPALAMNPQENIIRAAGCQISEMITVQLYRLFFPEKKGPEKAFHWIPEELERKLNIGGEELLMIVKEILISQQLLTKVISSQENNMPINFSPQESDGLNFIINTPPEDNPIKITRLDPNSLDFYALYGNCGATELQAGDYRSVEIDTLYLLNYLKKSLQNILKKSGKEPYYRNRKFSLQDSIKFIEKLIENEKEKSIKFNRDIQIFKGNVILFDANPAAQYLNNNLISDQIYTVSLNANKKPDLVANIGSKAAMAAVFPQENKYGAVCFNYASDSTINLENVLETAQRLLNDDGVLVFINTETKKETASKISFFGHLFNGPTKVKINNQIDALSMVTIAGFKSVKPLAQNNEKTGWSILIAGKSDNPIGMETICKNLPVLKEILESNNVNLEIYNSNVEGSQLN